MPDSHTEAIRDYLRIELPVLGISDFASAEFASVVTRRVRMAELAVEQADRLLNVYDGWVAANTEQLGVEPTDIRVATTFVRRFDLGLRAPDALHIAICQRLQVPLLTFDTRQAAAASHLGIQLSRCSPSVM
ncbi:MAG TPA: type II toxin-antitoxin system VapC family toxin [Acetobacteraceae bacterium]|nr:type II toxin-antitoxin system VapC family toxin [Acetobacteraceae bacterium]